MAVSLPVWMKIWKFLDKNDGICIADVVRGTGCAPSSVYTNIDMLVRMGIIRIHDEPRERLVFKTRKFSTTRDTFADVYKELSR